MTESNVLIIMGKKFSFFTVLMSPDTVYSNSVCHVVVRHEPHIIGLGGGQEGPQQLMQTQKLLLFNSGFGWVMPGVVYVIIPSTPMV